LKIDKISKNKFLRHAGTYHDEQIGGLFQYTNSYPTNFGTYGHWVLDKHCPIEEFLKCSWMFSEPTKHTGGYFSHNNPDKSVPICPHFKKIF